MSRLYGRTMDVYGISQYLVENYRYSYQKDKKETSMLELEKVSSKICDYLPDEAVKYLQDANIEIAWNLFTQDTIYSGVGEERNIIIFPTKKLKEDYKRDLVYYMGDLLRRLNLDYIPDEFDLRCQYSDVLPLILEYLYLRDSGKEERFSPKHLDDLLLNGEQYIKIYESFKARPDLFDENRFLRNTLLFLVPLSSMDATLQISDEIAKNKDALREIIKELIENPNHNREEVMNKRKIDTYGFKRLRKEIDFRKKK
jgi:hypothetical protein